MKHSPIRCGKSLSRGRSSSSLMLAVRREVWGELRRYRMFSCSLGGLSHTYLPVWDSFSTSELLEQVSTLETSALTLLQWKMLGEFGFGTHHSVGHSGERILLDSEGDDGEEGLVINRGIEVEGVEEQKMEEKNAVEIWFTLEGGGSVKVIIGLRDRLDGSFKPSILLFRLHLSLDDPEATYLGRPWSVALQRLGLAEQQVLHMQTTTLEYLGVVGGRREDSEHCTYLPRYIRRPGERQTKSGGGDQSPSSLSSPPPGVLPGGRGLLPGLATLSAPESSVWSRH